MRRNSRQAPVLAARPRRLPDAQRILLCLLVLCLLLGSGASPRLAWADPSEDPEPADAPGPEDAPEPADAPADDAELLDELLAGEKSGEWRGVLNRIVQEKNATWIGQVLGRIYRTPKLLEAHLGCAAFTAAYLADHHASGKVLLGDAIVRAAHGREELVSTIRSHITKGEGGWDRLLDHARALLASEDLTARRAAVYFLSQEDGEGRDKVRAELLEAARRDLGTVAQGSDGQGGLSAEYLEAFERMLGYRFPTLGEAVTWLTEHAESDLAKLILELSLAKNASDSPLRTRIVDYGKRLVDGVVASGPPKALTEFLDPELTPFPEIRRYAIEKAAQMGPEPNAAWGQLLRNVLAHESDRVVLRDALDLLERTGFAGLPEIAPRIAVALARRIRLRGPDPARGKDDPADRLRMAELLGSLKVRPAEFDLLLEMEDELDEAILAELVRALGGVPGVKAEELLGFYIRHAREQDGDELVRIAVIDALGRAGTRAEDGDAEVAAAALRELLTGQGDAGLGPSTNPDVRQHAIRSLGSHGGEATSSTLRQLALGKNDPEAKIAIVVLRQAADESPTAVAALGDVAQTDTLEAGRRVLALEALAGLSGGEATSLASARQSARAVLASEAPADVRLVAARAGASLGDPEALGPLLAFWSEAPDADRRAAIATLMLALAEAGEQHDAALAEALMHLGQSAGWDDAEASSRTLAEAHPRPGMALARARVLFARAGVKERDVDARRKDAREANVLLGTVLGPAVEADPLGALPLHVRVLRLAGELAESDVARRDRYLEAVHRATLGGGEDTAKIGLDLIAALLTPPLKDLLEPAQVQRLEAERTTLAARRGG